MKFRKKDDVISNSKDDVIIMMLMLRQLRKWKVFIVCLFLDGLS